MCGLFFSNTKKDLEGNSKKKISDFISHRGTYDPIMVEKKGMLFAHSLLPVQGKVPVFQPLIQNNNILVFSGEIWRHDNFNSDSEYLFKELIESRVSKKNIADLEGMFGFIFYLDEVKCVYFASDIFGEIPMYFVKHGKALRIANEIKQLCALGIDFKDAVPVMPGILYKYDIERDILSYENYHNWDFSNNQLKFDTRKIVQLIKKSVFEKYSTIDLQKSALLLSGGLDSAILAFELAHLGLKTSFTVAADTEAQDLKTAKVICDLLDLDFNPIIVNNLKPHCAIAISETSNRSIVEEMSCHIVLSNVLRDNGIQVVFSGCGADEIFVGYQHLLRYRNKETRKKLQADFVNNYYKMDLRAFNKIYMLNAIEVRNPFLSKNLLNYTSKLHVDELLIGRRREMKLALRQSYYKYLGDLVKIPKYIARETMGAKNILRNNYGDSPYVYRPLLRDIFCNHHKIIALMEEAKKTY